MYKRDRLLYSKPINGIRKIKISRSRDKRVMRLYGRKLLNGCNHPARFGGHRYCGSGDNMFLIYYVTSRGHLFKGLCDLMGWNFLIVSHYCATFSDRRSCGSCDKAAEIFFETLQNHVIKEPGDFMKGNSSLYNYTPPQMIGIDIVWLYM